MYDPTPPKGIQVPPKQVPPTLTAPVNPKIAEAINESMRRSGIVGDKIDQIPSIINSVANQLAAHNTKETKDIVDNAINGLRKHIDESINFIRSIPPVKHPLWPYIVIIILQVVIIVKLFA